MTNTTSSIHNYNIHLIKIQYRCEKKIFLVLKKKKTVDSEIIGNYEIMGDLKVLGDLKYGCLWIMSDLKNSPIFDCYLNYEFWVKIRVGEGPAPEYSLSLKKTATVNNKFWPPLNLVPKKLCQS